MKSKQTNKKTKKKQQQQKNKKTTTNKQTKAPSKKYQIDFSNMYL
jgi:hypothetical protein